MINLERANTKLKELDQLKSEFVSLATHQIRAPLSAIKGYISEIFEGDFGPYSKEIEKPLQVVFQSTENLVHIVGDFLNISRIEQGSMKYELKPLDLRQLVSESIKELKPNLDRAGLEMKFEAPDTENGYEVYADVGKIKEVIANLIDNSMKYTPKGGIKISLTSNAETQKILLAVSDTGIGIAPEVIPKLFQKFTRAKNANEVNIIGTGLGLYVAKLMVEGQGGRIWAESPGAGRGSTFYVELPIAHVS
jgi:signal transduction histidine kinase